MHSQLTIGSYGTYDTFGMRMLRDYTLDPPEVQTYTVDVPGMDGRLDLTGFAGDERYGMRSMEFTFDVGTGSFESVKTRVSKLIHGKEFDFTLPFDPGYTYHGRFSVSSYTDLFCDKGRIVMDVEADPYKSAGLVTFRINGAGGIRVRLPSGRCMVQPTIEVYRTTVVSYEGHDWTLEAGTWRLEDLWFHGGDNVLAVDTTPEYEHGVIEDYATDTLQAHADEMIAKLSMGDEPLQEETLISSVATEQLWDYETVRLIDMTHPASTADETYNVYVQYEIKEL